ncbi:MAG TPA: hypothetical protein VGG19_08275 [Tepidisphaeraceae bacterium]|jgi:hypothetical protein
MNAPNLWQSFQDYLPFWLGGAIVIFGLLVYGFFDLLKFNLGRVWAISSVCFAESIRRRVLLITPLAILGIFLVSQLEHPIDEADAIRQTIKVAMFATGLIVCVVMIILASTNLPKEIDSRVIYTIVTKPTTRLEIVLGKIVGFARVSATILIIMGIFTWGYLELRQWSLLRQVSARLNDPDVSAAHRGTMQHYLEKGLLSSKRYAEPVEMQVYSTLPTDEGHVRWVFGNYDQSILIPFTITPGQIAEAEKRGGAILAQLHVHQRRLTAEERQQTPDPLASLNAATVDDGAGPVNPAWKPKPIDAPPARVDFAIVSEGENALINSNQLGNGSAVLVNQPDGHPMQVSISPQQFQNLAKIPDGRFYVQITPATVASQYAIEMPTSAADSPVVLAVPEASGKPQFIPTSATESNAWSPIEFRAHSGSFGQQLKGGAPGTVPAGVYTFHNIPLHPDANGNVQFELNSGIERNEDTERPLEDITDVSVQALNSEYQPIGNPITVHPESLRTAYFELPAAQLSDGNFSLAIRSLSDDAWLGLKIDSIAAVVSSSTFTVNLIKSLLILWMMSILVVSVCIFCSTFLSWPIAIVLSVVLLLGHWGVLQLGDATNSGIGNQVATDLGFSNPAQAKVVSTTVEGLTKMLNTVSTVLPDISKFEASDNLERGVSMSGEQLLEALIVLVGFGVPLVTLAYVFLRNKEVAP